MIVSKFGGTSMGSAESIRSVGAIVEVEKKRQVIVVSAMSGVTDQLLGLGEVVQTGNEWETLFASLKQKHTDTITNLGVELDLSHYFDDLDTLLRGVSMTHDLSLKSRDYLLSFGERMSSEILSAYLNAQGVRALRFDARELIETDGDYSHAHVKQVETQEHIDQKLRPYLKDGMVCVITGFVGGDTEGHYTTLGRGGSDYSAAIFAHAFDAEKLEIWTDVSGIMTTDPRIVSTAKSIMHMSYDEAAELAFFGAKVLHPKTIQPAVRKNIPVHILNTFAPDDPGTVISEETDETVKSVTYKKGVTIINICSSRMLEAKGFLRKIFQVFDEFGVVVDVVSTSEVSVSVTVNEKPGDRFITALSEYATVKVFGGKAIVSLVGKGIRNSSEILARLFVSLDGAEVEMVSQGASQKNITLVVGEDGVNEIVKNVYRAFFSD
jgi:aspartate kinase